MTTNIKYAIIFVSGVAIGSGITWIALKKKYEDLAEKEIAEARNYYQNKVKSIYKGEPEKHKKVDQKPTELIRERSTIDYSADKKNKTVVDYTKYYDKKPDPAEMEYPVEGDSNEEEHLNYRDGKRDSEEAAALHGIIAISPEEFAVGFTNHEKITLFYWMDDDTLSTEEEELIDDPARVVGDCLETTGFKYSDSDVDVIYVRNFDLGCDYEVQRFPSSYAEQIMY